MTTLHTVYLNRSLTSLWQLQWSFVRTVIDNMSKTRIQFRLNVIAWGTWFRRPDCLSLPLYRWVKMANIISFNFSTRNYARLHTNDIIRFWQQNHYYRCLLPMLYQQDLVMCYSLAVCLKTKNFGFFLLFSQKMNSSAPGADDVSVRVSLCFINKADSNIPWNDPSTLRHIYL